MTYGGTEKNRVPIDTTIIAHYYYLSRVNCKSFVWCGLWATMNTVGGINSEPAP